VAGKLQDLNYLHLYYFWTVAGAGSITAACALLHVTQPTISMQIRRLEQAMRAKLFERVGRGLRLTEVGRVVFDYAEDIFSLGQALVDTVNGTSSAKRPRLVVGIPNGMPKVVTCRLLEPLLHQPEDVRLVCYEADLHSLVTDLAKHRFDVILSDMPLSPGSNVRTYNHPLGESAVAFCGKREVISSLRARFPQSLHGAPMLLPTTNVELRRNLDRWFAKENIVPRIVAEIEDGALIKEFGSGGAGVFPLPSAVVSEVRQQYNLSMLGTLSDVKVRYYAITTERKLKNPLVMLISEIARKGLLD
jgi:LysR family transcriptional activator of nhaA